MMMSNFAYSSNGLHWNNPAVRLNYELNLELDSIDYSDGYVQVPISNIIGANAIYFFQSRRLVLQSEIILLQDDQIEDYKLSIHSCYEEIRFYNEGLETCQKILDTKDKIIKQETRKTWVYRSLTIALLGYTAYSFFN